MFATASINLARPDSSLRILLSVVDSAMIASAFFLRAAFALPIDENSMEQSIKSSVNESRTSGSRANSNEPPRLDVVLKKD